MNGVKLWLYKVLKCLHYVDTVENIFVVLNMLVPRSDVVIQNTWLQNIPDIFTAIWTVLYPALIQTGT